MTFETANIYNENEWAKLMRSELLTIIQEELYTAGLDPVAQALGFVDEMVTYKDGKYTSMLGFTDMEELGEFDEFPIDNKEQGFEKWFELKRFGKGIAISKPLEKWIEASVKDAKYTPDVKRELQKLSRDVSRLVGSAKLTRNNLVTKVLANWFDITAGFWPGSTSPDGVALFSASHIIKSTGNTQSNLVSGALTQAKLEEAIDLLRNMRDGMGRKMRRASVYTLVVSSENEKNARQILNDGSNFAASVSDTETNNGVTSNLFMWDGFKIELLVLDTLNQPSVSGNVGSATMWFVINKDCVRDYEAFRMLTLYNDEIDMYRDNKTKALVVDLDFSATADHYQPECIVGSTWV